MGERCHPKSIEVIKWPPRNAASTVSKEEKLKERTESLHEIFSNSQEAKFYHNWIMLVAVTMLDKVSNCHNLSIELIL